MSNQSLKLIKSIFAFAGREINTVNLKVIFDNIRNYALTALILKGFKTIIPGDLPGSLLVIPAFIVSILLVSANVAQSYLIAYRFFSGMQSKVPGDDNRPASVFVMIGCGLMALIFGGSLVYIIFKAIS